MDQKNPDQKIQNADTHQKNPNQQQAQQRPTPSHETHPIDKSRQQTGWQNKPGQPSGMGQDKR